jgi:hypothetical protein
MKASELKDKIRALALQVVDERNVADESASEYDELTKFPALKDIIVDLLTHEFNSFLESIDWISPRPTSFRINLLNGQNFILTYTERSWIAQVEGKRYYLLNLDEEEYAAQAIGRILQYGGAKSGADVAETDAETKDTGAEEEVDVNVDTEA